MFWKKALSVIICLSLLAGCGKESSKKPQTENEPQPSSVSVTEPSEIENLAEKISTDYRVAEPCIVKDDLLAGLLDIAKEDTLEYAGYVSMTPDVPDCIIIVRTDEKKTNKILKKLETRCEFILDAYKNAPEEQRLKAEAGTVFSVQDCVVLVVAGRPTKDPRNEIQDITALVEKTLE